MTSSRSIISKSSWLALVVAVLFATVANAGTRRRIVVLDFEGPKAEKFHDDLVKLIKKSHTVIATEKWNGKAEELDAGKVTEKNVKKVAKALKIDGVVTGKIEKKHDEYVVQLRIRAGSSGEVVGDRIDAKSETTKLDHDVKDQLVAALDGLKANHGEGGDDDTAEAKPKKHKGGDDDETAEKPKKHKGGDDDETAEKPKKHKGGDDDETAEKPKKHKGGDDDEAASSDDEKPRKKKHGDDDEGSHHRKKKVAEGEDENSVDTVEEEVALTPEEAMQPGNRAVDFTVGMSFTARRLSFNSDADLGNPPPAYKQSIPVAGGIMDATVYPMAFSHKNKGMINNLGLEVMFDKVIKISSQKKYLDSMMVQQVASLGTVEQRFSFGAVVRYPMGPITIGGKLLYSNQQFNVDQSALPNGMSPDIPDVEYSMVEPKGFLQYTLSDKLIVDVDAGFMIVTNTGDISKNTSYGQMTATGYEANVGFDYRLTQNLFVRALARYETISMSFKGTPGSMADSRDGDPAQDVKGATDGYFGAMATIGYIY